MRAIFPCCIFFFRPQLEEMVVEKESSPLSYPTSFTFDQIVYFITNSLVRVNKSAAVCFSFVILLLLVLVLLLFVASLATSTGNRTHTTCYLYQCYSCLSVSGVRKGMVGRCWCCCYCIYRNFPINTNYKYFLLSYMENFGEDQFFFILDICVRGQQRRGG